MPASWFVYMIETEAQKLYTGITTDPERRFQEHLNSPKGAKYFRSDRPVRIVFLESCRDRSHASQRERAIKKLTRARKLRLIPQATPA